MRLTRIVYAVSLLLAGLGLAMNGRSQVYQFSTPITGGMGLTISDANGPSGSSGSISLTFTNLLETVYLDPVGQTIRQVGIVSYTVSAHSISIQETQSVSQFPHPPVNVSGGVTVTVDLSGGKLSFDTGVKAITWSGPEQGYTFDATIGNIPVVGSYSLATGGQTYTGTFDYYLYNALGGANTYSWLSTVGYPQSILLNRMGTYGGMFCLAISKKPLIDVVAANGFEMRLTGGTYSWGLLDAEGFGWNSPLVTATNVPSGAATVTNQPQSLFAHAHDAASFTVGATGTVPLSYQWSLNGTNIPGATASILTLADVAQRDLGAYVVVVTNAFGSVTSSNAMLFMYPFIAIPFSGAVTYWGKPATFDLQAWGTSPLTYQWFKDGDKLLNATNSYLLFTSMQSTNAGLYSVVVSNPLGTITNTPAQVIVYPAGVSLGFAPTVTINGVIGYSYTIQRTTDLVNTNSWVTRTNLTLTQPVLLWVDASVDATSPFNSKYYYRVVPGQ